uniref:Uncharacterized protein n=1 Tax=Chenopodium quinoa TaxID=63459 RepID=A0A803MAF6_CHEQI
MTTVIVYVDDILVTGSNTDSTLVRDWAHHDQLVTSTTIENAVSILMATEGGQQIRKRATDLGDSIRGSPAKGGAACKERN